MFNFETMKVKFSYILAISLGPYLTLNYTRSVYFIFKNAKDC